MALGTSPLGIDELGGGSQIIASAVYVNFLRSLYPDSHNIDGPVYTAMLGAMGAALDMFDPYQLGLPSEFSVTTAQTTALDSNGRDWGVIRRSGESDITYRARILSMLPVYANGASDPGITAAVAVFTGANPVLIDCSSDGFVCGTTDDASAIGEAGMSDLAGLFTIYLMIANPDSLSYSHYDMEFSVMRGLPARSRAIIFHNGTDTSVLNEASDAIVIVVG